jgi:thiol-disulfide isomerase/thioredoxin
MKIPATIRQILSSKYLLPTILAIVFIAVLVFLFTGTSMFGGSGAAFTREGML